MVGTAELVALRQPWRRVNSHPTRRPGTIASDRKKQVLRDHRGGDYAGSAFFVLVGIVIFVLGCVATGGIIHAAVEHNAGHDYRLGTAWRSGYATGWRIAGLRLLTFLLAFVPGLLVGTLVLATVVAAMNSAAGAAGFGLFAAVAFLVSMAFWLALGVAFELAQRIVVLNTAS
jgi:hypothetical protein